MQVELAFRKFDLDRDGFLSWDEFRQVRTFLFILCALVFYCFGVVCWCCGCFSCSAFWCFDIDIYMYSWTPSWRCFIILTLTREALWIEMLKQASLWSGFQVLTISYHIAFLRIYLGKVKMAENVQLLYS